MLVHVGRFFSRSGDDQRGSGLINKNTVHLIHNGKIEFPLGQGLFIKLHVVPQVIKTELIVGAVGDVCIVGIFSLCIIEIMDNDADTQSQKAVYGIHPLCVTFGQVIIDRHHMNSPAGKGIEAGGQG